MKEGDTLVTWSLGHLGAFVNRHSGCKCRYKVVQVVINQVSAKTMLRL